MNNAANLSINTSERKLTFTRIIDARCEIVFKAWIDPKQMAQWWGPGFTNPVCGLDVRQGGAIRINRAWAD